MHFIWKNGLYEPHDAVTCEGEKVEIISPGRHNFHAGPDFFDARIRIGQTLWAGNVEIHLKASDWNRHGHQEDPLYRNTILHVVADNDLVVKNDAGCIVPAMVISWPLWIEYNFSELMQKHDWVNCLSYLNKIDPFRIRFFLNGLAVERLQNKIRIAEVLLESLRNDWSETFYRMLARSFGFRQNGDPFEMLAGSLPMSLLQRHSSSLFQLEALLFGQAGLLNSFSLSDEYPAALKKEHQFLAAKYGLAPIAGHLWKFMRMHPLNFPTIRIAQLAASLYASGSLFSSLLGAQTVGECRRLFIAETSSFWDFHYTFQKSSPERRKWMGEDSFRVILVNLVVPFLFLFGDRHGKQELKDRALKFMEELPPESNSIIRHWEAAGILPANALESQALLHLHHEYCELGRCLDCSIGHKVILHG